MAQMLHYAAVRPDLMSHHLLQYRRASGDPRLYEDDGMEEMGFEQLLSRFGDGSENKGASADTIANLPVYEYRKPDRPESEDMRSCSVCLEDFAAAEVLRTLPCFHRYHKDCIDEWLLRDATCPVCKHAVS